MAEQFNAGDILVRLTLDASSYIHGLQDSRAQTEQFQRQLTQVRLPELQLNQTALRQSLGEAEQLFDQFSRRLQSVQQRLPAPTVNTEQFTQQLNQTEQRYQAFLQRMQAANRVQLIVPAFHPAEERFSTRELIGFIGEDAREEAAARVRARARADRESMRAWRSRPAGTQDALMDLSTPEDAEPGDEDEKGKRQVRALGQQVTAWQAARRSLEGFREQAAGLFTFIARDVPQLDLMGRGLLNVTRGFTAAGVASETASSGVARFVLGAGGVIGVAAGAALALGSLAHSAGEFGLALTREHAATGIAIQDLQAMELVVKRVGGSTEELHTSIRTLQRTSAEALRNPDSREASLYQTLGFDRSNLQRAQDPGQFLEFMGQVARAVQTVRQSSLATGEAIAQMLMGRGFQRAALEMEQFAQGARHVRDEAATIKAPYSDEDIRRMTEAGMRWNTLAEQAKLLVMVDVPNWISKAFGASVARDINDITSAVERVTAAMKGLTGLDLGKIGELLDRWSRRLPGEQALLGQGAPAAGSPVGLPGGAFPDVVPESMRSSFAQAAERFRVPLPLLLQTAGRESSFDPQATSNAPGGGARGVMQIMPSTAAAHGYRDPNALYRPAVNIPLGAEILKDELDAFQAYGKEGEQYAMMAFNAGRDNVMRALRQLERRGIPPSPAAVIPLLPKPEETGPYVRDIFQGRAGLPYPQGILNLPASAGIQASGVYGGLSQGFEPRTSPYELGGLPGMASGAQASPTPSRGEDPLQTTELRLRRIQELEALRRQALSTSIQLQVQQVEREEGSNRAAQRRTELERQQIEVEEQFRRAMTQAADPIGLLESEIVKATRANETLLVGLAKLEQLPAMRQLVTQVQLFGRGVAEGEEGLRLIDQHIRALAQAGNQRGEPYTAALETARTERLRRDVELQPSRFAADLGRQVQSTVQEQSRGQIALRVALEADPRPLAQLEERLRAVDQASGLVLGNIQHLSELMRTGGFTPAQFERIQLAVMEVATGATSVDEAFRNVQRLDVFQGEKAERFQVLLQRVHDDATQVYDVMRDLGTLQPFSPDTLARTNQQLDQQLARYQELRKEARQLHFDTEVQRGTQALDAQLSTLKAQLAVSGETLQAQRASTLLHERVKGIEAQQGAPPSDAVVAGWKRVTDAIAAYEIRVDNAKQPLRDLAENHLTAFRRMQDGTVQILGSLESTLTDFFTTGTLDATRFAETVSRTINQIAVRAFITEPLAGLLNTGIQSLQGTGLGNLLGAPKPARDGGLYTSATNLLVGEAGPELVVPVRAFAEGGVAGGPAASGDPQTIWSWLSGLFQTQSSPVSSQGARTDFTFAQLMRRVAPLAGASIGGALGASLIPASSLSAEMAAYEARFRPMREDGTGHTWMGGVDTATRIDWASRAPGAVGYRPPPTESGTPQWLRSLVSVIGTFAGAAAGKAAGGSSTGDYGGLSQGYDQGSIPYDYGLENAMGGRYDRATFGVLGEAGPEAVVPLRGGGIPATRARDGRLMARLPSGPEIPIVTVPGFALGGTVGDYGETVMRQHAFAPSRGWGGGAMASRGNGPLVVMNVTTPNPDAFRASQGQITTGLAQELHRNMLRNG